MTKKTIIIAIVFLFLTLLALGILFALKSKNKPTQQLKAYKVEVHYNNGKISGLSYENEIWKNLQNETELQNYAYIIFNNPKDIMWVVCKDGFNITEANSITDKNIFIDKIIGASITLFENQDNILTLSCQQNTP